MPPQHRKTPLDLESLGRFVRQRRQELHLTQQQLAGRVGWRQARISQLENAKYGLPSLPHLALLADALEVGPWQVLDALGCRDASHMADDINSLLYELSLLEDVIESAALLQRQIEEHVATLKQEITSLAGAVADSA